MQKSKMNIVIGSMAGSESKGKLAGYLAAKYKPEITCMASSPNAGHSIILGDKKFVSYHLPVSFVTNRDSVICLGPTSLLSLPILQKEIAACQVPDSKLVIHPRAVMIRDHYLHEEREQGLLKIGSTNQGVGVARREKVMRVEDISYAADIPELKKYLGDTVTLVNDCMDRGGTVLCEMTQGFDLCLEHGIDPHYCTSKMINPAMGAAEAGVSPKRVGNIYGVMRPYPIRVSNREGSSGPYAGAKEITWEEVALRSGFPGVLAEITTTTKLPRRVFEFSPRRMKRFIQICGPTHMCLQFANYIDHKAFGVRVWEDLPAGVQNWVTDFEATFGVSITYIGTGPDHDDMIDVSHVYSNGK